MKKTTSTSCFKRANQCLSETCEFYKAAFTTQISRVRFNQQLRARRNQNRHRYSFI